MSTSEGKQIVFTENAPKPIRPYSQAVRVEDLVYAAGQAALPINARIENEMVALIVAR